MLTAAPSGTRQQRIRTALEAHLQPQRLEVEDESGNHSVPPGAESHFRLLIVSDLFVGKTRIARHKMIYALLNSELSSGLHALTMQAMTQQEWQASGSRARMSPDCLGGGR